MALVELTFYGGVSEIGGNKILLKDRNTKLLIDFGLSYGRRALFFDEFLNPRVSNGLGDFLRFGLLPNLKGVYRDDMLATVGRKPEPVQIDGVLLSHAHLDHASYISFLHEAIPIYCGETSKLILQSLQEAGDRDIEREILSFKPRPLSRGSTEVARKIKTFRTGDHFNVGDVEVQPIHVDHSIPGDYGFLISTSEGTVAYTSDFRMHGTHPEMTQEFVEASKKAEPVALITEGTRVDEAKADAGEPGVRKGCEDTVKNARQLVVADFNLRDIDRFRTFLDIAKSTGRKLAIRLRDAYLLKHLNLDPKLGVPPPDHPDIVLILPKRGSGKYQPEDYGISDRQFLKNSNISTPEKLTEMQSEILACLGYYDMGTISDLNPNPEGIYIHSSSEAYNEEMVLDMKRLRHWTDFFQMAYYQSHASGHAGGHEIMDMLRKVNPRTVFPIHTESPESFKGVAKNTVMVQQGKPYTISA